MPTFLSTFPIPVSLQGKEITQQPLKTLEKLSKNLVIATALLCQEALGRKLSLQTG